jgi:hypothetical protein
LLECSSVLVVAALLWAGTVVLHDPNKVLSSYPGPAGRRHAS